MKAYKVILITLLALTSAACAIVPQQPLTFYRQDASQMQADRDLRECQYDAIRFKPADNPHMGLFGQAIEEGINKRKIVIACMTSRDYRSY